MKKVQNPLYAKLNSLTVGELLDIVKEVFAKNKQQKFSRTTILQEVLKLLGQKDIKSNVKALLMKFGELGIYLTDYQSRITLVISKQLQENRLSDKIELRSSPSELSLKEVFYCIISYKKHFNYSNMVLLDEGVAARRIDSITIRAIADTLGIKGDTLQSKLSFFKISNFENLLRKINNYLNTIQSESLTEALVPPTDDHLCNMFLHVMFSMEEGFTEGQKENLILLYKTNAEFVNGKNNIIEYVNMEQLSHYLDEYISKSHHRKKSTHVQAKVSCANDVSQHQIEMVADAENSLVIEATVPAAIDSTTNNLDEKLNELTINELLIKVRKGFNELKPKPDSKTVLLTNIYIREKVVDYILSELDQAINLANRRLLLRRLGYLGIYLVYSGKSLKLVAHKDDGVEEERIHLASKKHILFSLKDILRCLVYWNRDFVHNDLEILDELSLSQTTKAKDYEIKFSSVADLLGVSLEAIKTKLSFFKIQGEISEISKKFCDILDNTCEIKSSPTDQDLDAAFTQLILSRDEFNKEQEKNLVILCNSSKALKEDIFVYLSQIKLVNYLNKNKVVNSTINECEDINQDEVASKKPPAKKTKKKIDADEQSSKKESKKKSKKSNEKNTKKKSKKRSHDERDQTDSILPDALKNNADSSQYGARKKIRLANLETDNSDVQILGNINNGQDSAFDLSGMKPNSEPKKRSMTTRKSKKKLDTDEQSSRNTSEKTSIRSGETTSKKKSKKRSRDENDQTVIATVDISESDNADCPENLVGKKIRLDNLQATRGDTLDVFTVNLGENQNNTLLDIIPNENTPLSNFQNHSLDCNDSTNADEASEAITLDYIMKNKEEFERPNNSSVVIASMLAGLVSKNPMTFFGMSNNPIRIPEISQVERNDEANILTTPPIINSDPLENDYNIEGIISFFDENISVESPLLNFNNFDDFQKSGNTQCDDDQHVTGKNGFSF